MIHRFPRPDRSWSLALALLAGGVRLAFAAASQLAPDEKLIFYPATAWRSGSAWELSIHGVVYEPEQRSLLAHGLSRGLGLEGENLSAAEKAAFAERIRYFFVDNQRGKRFSARIASQTFRLGNSAANGHFTAKVRLPRGEWPALDSMFADTNLVLLVQLVPGTQPAERFPVPVQVLHETGLSVISDIDDTIKISEIHDRAALVRNTFCRPFKPVAGMAGVYQTWARTAGAQFHYVTASPWQLYLPLSEFLQTNGFPSGTFQMKSFRAKDGSFVQLFAAPERYKPKVIEPLLTKFPRRHFILVGDSGEQDPEIYGAIARRYPAQVRQILIRDVTGDAATGARYQKAFTGLPAGLWRVFQKPAEIKDAISAVP